MVDGFISFVFLLCTLPRALSFDSFDSAERIGRSTYSNSDSWTFEELWPKEKAIIHVKLIKPTQRDIPVWELRHKDTYLSDPSLDFDSPLISQTFNNCLIEYKAVESYSDEDDGLLQAQISGPECLSLPLSLLHPSSNLTHLVIRDTGIVNLTKFIFGAAKLDKLTRIDIINNNHLRQIRTRAFDGITRLAYLAFINNLQIDEVSIEAFAGLKTLEELVWVDNGDISSTKFSLLLQSASVRILPNLYHLHLSSNSAHNNSRNRAKLKIDKDDLRYMTQIKYLQLTDCDITSLHPFSLVPLKSNIIGLNLSGNKINVSSLKQSLVNAFQLNSSETVIDKLDLSSVTSAKSLPKDLLSVISKTKITELHISSQYLTRIMDGDIPPMPNLRFLHIDTTKLEYIEENAFSTLEELKKLSLKENYLLTVPSNFLSNLPNLEHLDLSGYKNDRTKFEIPLKTFVQGTNLREVNLSYKVLDPLPRQAFLGLFKVRRFFMRGCGLKFIEYLTFFPLKSIVYFDISENEELIKSIRVTGEDAFFGLEAVQTFRMSRCDLSSKDITGNDSILKRIQEHVQFLDLSHNHIGEIRAETFTNFTDLQGLDLSYNAIKMWSNYSIFSKNRYITMLDISNNKIEHFSEKMLEDFHNLRNFSFARNPIVCDCHSRVVIDWLNDTTRINFLRGHHPLRSKDQYYCISAQGDKTNFKLFIDECMNARLNSNRVNLTLLSAMAGVVLLLALILLILAFIYHSTLRKFFTGFEEDLYDYEYDAFVSYNANDSEWVFKQLVPNLENNDNESHRIKLCVYDRDFIAGRPISECIAESIKTSRKVILVISNNFIKSPWCRFETDLAHNTLVDQNRDGLILVKLEEIDSEKIAPQLHFLLKTRIYLLWSHENVNEQDIFWRKLRRALGFHRNLKPTVINQKDKLFLLTSNNQLKSNETKESKNLDKVELTVTEKNIKNTTKKEKESENAVPIAIAS